jgi:hypothetical protein
VTPRLSIQSRDELEDFRSAGETLVEGVFIDGAQPVGGRRIALEHRLRHYGLAMDGFLYLRIHIDTPALFLLLCPEMEASGMPALDILAIQFDTFIFLIWCK